MPDTFPGLLWAPRAWLPGGWHRDVLLQVGTDGCWLRVEPGTSPPPRAQRLPAPVLPGLVNGHSHAFQRAFAGLAEQGTRDEDSLHAWRDRMDRVAQVLTPDALRVVATQLYRELLQGGYTQVCEFQDLHRPPEDHPSPQAMSAALVAAARDAGIGLTLLPVLRERAGHDRPGMPPHQHRFHCPAEDVWALHRWVQQQSSITLQAGMAVHSLRAVRPATLHLLQKLAADLNGPIHIPVAEQLADVLDCLAHTGRRPVEWLASEGLLDERWVLLHATHVRQAEVMAVSHSGCTVVLCPSTESRLGDGLTDLEPWLRAEVPVAVGSDRQLARDWRQELRWLAYGQQLSQEAACADTTRLWSLALQGGAQAAGFAQWGLMPGARADLLVADPGQRALHHPPASDDELLDRLVFCGDATPWQRVMVAGRWVVDARVRPGVPVACTQRSA